MLSIVRPHELSRGPRPATTDERLERILVRNAFVQKADDRVIPAVYDDLVGLVWTGERYVVAVIPDELTPLALLEENLRRPIAVVLFEGTRAQLARLRPGPTTVSGTPFDRAREDQLEQFRQFYWRRLRQFKYHGHR